MLMMFHVMLVLLVTNENLELPNFTNNYKLDLKCSMIISLLELNFRTKGAPRILKDFSARKNWIDHLDLFLAEDTHCLCSEQ